MVPLARVPEINYSMIDPSKYTVDIKNAENRYLLVFSELYNSNWRAYINKVEIPRHLLVNGYANAWFINKAGDYEVSLEFLPEKTLKYSYVISLIGLSSLLIILVIYKFKKSKVQ